MFVESGVLAKIQNKGGKEFGQILDMCCRDFLSAKELL